MQGGTIKPLVGLLDIRKQNKEEKLLLFTELNANVTDHLMAGIEEIVGRHGQNFIYVSTEILINMYLDTEHVL